MVASLTAEPDRVRVDVEIEEEANWRPNVVIPLGLVAGGGFDQRIQARFSE